MQKILFLLLLIAGYANAQKGRISGVVTDGATGETLPGATILVEGTTIGAAADIDGHFVISNVPAGRVNLVASYISYADMRVDNVVVTDGGNTPVSFKLKTSESQDLQVVEVVTTIERDNNVALVLDQKNNAAVSDGVSSETIRKTPDRTSSDVLRRVSGVTVQDDKFVIVRGLNERYNASCLNESPLPSTESDRKAFSFDLIPANMLDNIVVNKTATPDMPGEFAGGIVRVSTKGIPDHNFITVTGGTGFNTITTGRAKYTYAGGKGDAFGFDDGSRNLPAQVPSLKDKGTWISSADQARMGTYFSNDWAYSKGTFAPNTQAQLTAGYNFKRRNRDFLGAMFGLTYNSTQNAYRFDRMEYDGLSVTGTGTATVEKDRDYSNTVSQSQNMSGALLNLTCKMNANNTISVKNLFNSLTDNRFIYSVGSNNVNETNKIMNRVTSRYFTANQILSSQLNTEHYLPGPGITLTFNGGVSTVKRSVPNMRFSSYSRNAIVTPENPSEQLNPHDTLYRAEIGTSTGPNYAGYRVYSTLNEKVLNGRFDASRTFTTGSNSTLNLKAGVFYQQRQRAYTLRQFGLQQYQNMAQGVYRDDSLLYLPEDQIFAQQNMGVTPLNTGGFKLFEATKADDNYLGFSALKAAYAMGEAKVSDRLRVIGGLRYESYTQRITVNYVRFDSVFVNSTVNDLLPSINLVYSLSEKTAVRLAWYKTLNRAEFRELALSNWYDPETRLSIAGNPALQRCYIQNYDARFEVYPGRGQLFTVSAFYKYFKNPIERYMYVGNESQVYFRNANYATLMGTELEYRVNAGALFHRDSSELLNALSLFTNLSLMKSVVNVAGINDALPTTRPMQGQAPYLVNAGVTYNSRKLGFNATMMVNRAGQRIYLVGNDQIPNRWENPRTVLDMQLGKLLMKKRLELRLNIKDLLHPDWIIYYKGTNSTRGYDKRTDYVNYRRNFGTTYTLLASYTF